MVSAQSRWSKPQFAEDTSIIQFWKLTPQHPQLLSLSEPSKRGRSPTIVGLIRTQTEGLVLDPIRA